MISLSKQGALRVQSSKIFRYVRVNSQSEHPYMLIMTHNIAEVTSGGKLLKVLLPGKDVKVLIVGISDDKSLVAGVLSNGSVVLWSKHKRLFQSFLVPPQLKLAFDKYKKDYCGIGVSSKGILIIDPDEQVWLWKPDPDFSDPNNLSPHLKGTWVNLTSSTLNKIRNRKINSSRVSPADSPTSSSPRKQAAKSRYNSFAYSIRFTHDHIRGQAANVLRVWLRSANKESCTIESLYFLAKINDLEQTTPKGSSTFKLEKYVCKGQLEFWSKKGSKDMGLIVRLDNKGSLAAIAVNSSHPFFCQLVFMNPATGIASTRKLCNYVTVDDMPSTSQDGHTSFWIDDMSWSPDDTYLAVIYRVGYFSIFSRLGEPICTSVEMIRTVPEARIFSLLIFTTDPELLKDGAVLMSVDWGATEILVSDGYTITNLKIVHCPSIKDHIAQYLPQEIELHDVTINISHDTNPLPSDMDSGPRRKNLDQAVLLLRSVISNPTVYTKFLFDQIASYIETVIPPQLHEEINYTTIQNIGEMSDSKLSSNLILKKKIHAVEVYSHLHQLIDLLGYSICSSSDFFDWIIYVGSKVFIYMLSDHQAPYAFNVLATLEDWLGFKLQRLRNVLIVYSLIQYRNHQANHLNIVYFVITYVALREKQRVIQKPTESGFLRMFLKENMDLAQASDEKNQEKSIFPSFYINPASRRSIDCNLHYLLGMPQSFEEIGQEVCFQLTKGNIQHVEGYHNLEFIPLLAFYLDPKEPLFLSPVEYQSVPFQSAKNISELLSGIKSLATVPLQKDEKTTKDSAFLYWCLGSFNKLQELLPSDMAFYAINSLLDNLKTEEVLDAIEVMKALFVKCDFLAVIDSISPSIQPLFRTLGIYSIREEIASILLNQKEEWIGVDEDWLISKICNYFIPCIKTDKLLSQLIYLSGSVKINKKVHNSSWLSPLIAELDGVSQVTIETKNLLHDVYKCFWYIKLRGHLMTGKHPSSAIRLISFIDIEDKNKIYNFIIESLWEADNSIVELIALYFRESEIPIHLLGPFEDWKNFIREKDQTFYQQVCQALKQPPYNSPWLFDEDFLNFSEEISKLTIAQQKTKDSVAKSWDLSVKSLKKQYRIESRIMFSNGSFSYIKSVDPWDPLAVISAFTLDLPSLALNPNKHHSHQSDLPSPLITMKKRLKLSVNDPEDFYDEYPLTLHKIIACKRFASIFRANLKPMFGKLLRKKKRYKMPPLPKPAQQKNTSNGAVAFQFICFKSPLGAETERRVLNTPRNLPLSFAHLLETSGKNPRHRRAQSVVEISEPQSQKPFQLIRVQNSNLRL
ncbi:unnamed protein product [Blepharisma stoltei]|uniref:Uncharacterized protein n=1 Tax=Blepharisma stoltei TaxID=1481888 RepID=A0AAU9IQA6_9CILI|nr:unnamed protein product [Blepharisma stoltei]